MDPTLLIANMEWIFCALDPGWDRLLLLHQSITADCLLQPALPVITSDVYGKRCAHCCRTEHVL